MSHRASLIEETCAAIQPVDQDAFTAARAHLDTLTKPLGSLGRLEGLAAQWVAVRKTRAGEPIRKAAYVFAADHGVTVEGVSAYPREVTQQMVLNFVRGGAAINVLAKLHGVDLNIVDMGVDADLSTCPGLLHRKVARGTANLAVESAMTEEQMMQALAVGIDLVGQAAAENVSLLAVGEMGIGNTTSAAAITCALTGADAELATGRGTGLSDAARTHKIAVVRRALALHLAGSQPDGFEILCCVGGFEIAAMAGMILGAARHRMMMLCDGFIATAAAALAVALAPDTRDYLVAGHCSAEPGHRLLLDHLQLVPLLTLDMRLGEGTGAVLAVPIVESAIALYFNMATFAAAGVSEEQA